MSVQIGVHSILGSFPSYEHVASVCKMGEGEKTCRYLVVGKGGLECAKASNLRDVLDERVKKGDLGAKGDNCGGILELLIDNQSELVGKRTKQVESGPYFEQEAEFKSIEFRDGMVVVRTTKDGYLSIAENHTLIEVKEDSITITARVVGAMVGELIIFLDS